MQNRNIRSKTNKMVTTKWTYYKERSFSNNYFISLKFFLSLRTCNKELICCANDPTQMPFCKRWSFDDVFALRVSLGYFI